MSLPAIADANGAGFSRTLAAFRAEGRFDMAFGGRVGNGGNSFAITGMCGARTAALANLVVRHGEGLGGKSLLLGRPVSVTNYHQAQGITHVYDHAVGQESLETVVSLPVVVDRVPRMVIYLGNRTQVGLGDRWFDAFAPMVRQLERDIAVDDEVRRRLELLAPTPEADLSRGDLQDIADELADLSEQIADDDLRHRLEAVQQRLSGRTPRRTESVVQLSPRELDVLAEIAQGCSNQQVADNLGLLPNTVKSYLKTAMRKLQAGNRVHAIALARQAGLIR
ncbi:MAG TPA: LuxR C-terminal-related transcriptional regulator [Nocardioides sp.]